MTTKTKLPKKLEDRIPYYQELLKGTARSDQLRSRARRAKEYLERSTVVPDGRTLRAIMNGTCICFFRTEVPGVLELGTGGERVTGATLLTVANE